MSYPRVGIPRNVQNPLEKPGQYGFSAPTNGPATPLNHSNIEDLDASPYYLRPAWLRKSKVKTYYKSNPIGYQKDPIVGILPSAAMKNGAQKTYVEGDFLFVNRHLNQDGHKQTVLNLPYINAILEESCVVKRGNYVGDKRTHEAMKRIASLNVPDSDKSEMYCFTVQEFSEKWQYAGPMATRLGDLKDRERFFTVVFKRAAKVPNLWGNIETGDRVGFIVKEIQNPYPSRYGPLGESISTPTPGKILQIVPHATKGRRYPAHVTTQNQNSGNLHDSVQKTDISFVKTEAFKDQKLYKTHKEYNPELGIYPGMIDVTSPIEDDSFKMTVTEIVQSGLYIPVGVVTEVNSADPPSQTEINDALRIPDAYMKLLRTHKIEICIAHW